MGRLDHVHIRVPIGLALFQASEGHPMVPQQTGVAFSVDAETFMSFARALPCGIDYLDSTPS